MKQPLKCVDFFCGGGGMSYGMQQAGLRVLAALDNDKHCKETYEKNHPSAKFLLKDIKKYTPKQMERDVPEVARKDKNLVFIGCSPCQHWSIITGGKSDATRKASSLDTRNLLNDFLRFVRHFRPGFVVVENVRGAKRNEKESGLDSLFAFLKKNGYTYNEKIVSLADYGVPQTRNRYVLLASRLGDIPFPKKTEEKPKTVRDFIGDLSKIKAGNPAPKSAPLHKSPSLSKTNIKRLELTPHGGARKSWAKRKDLMIDAYRGKASGSYFRENYGRMSWDKPAPTITTRFYAIACGRFAHPKQNRAISLREGARLQTFPDTYDFMTDAFATTARIIGNAVPPDFAKIIGETITKAAGNAATKKGNSFSREKRSWVMSRVSSRGNQSTEVAFARLLRGRKISGWRRQWRMEGNPDFVFVKRKIAVFVDGCFWHGCPLHGQIPATNRAFWRKKLLANMRRDKSVSRKLRRMGWHVFRFWEHELRGNTINRKLGKIAKLLKDG